MFAYLFPLQIGPAMVTTSGALIWQGELAVPFDIVIFGESAYNQARNKYISTKVYVVS